MSLRIPPAWLLPFTINGYLATATIHQGGIHIERTRAGRINGNHSADIPWHELVGIDFLEPNFFRNGHVHFATFNDPRGLTSTGNGNRMAASARNPHAILFAWHQSRAYRQLRNFLTGDVPMDDRLVTRTYRVKSFLLVLKTEPGVLRLQEGFISFTSEDGRLVFRAPLQEVHASFPKFIILLILFPGFGIGIKLTVHGIAYRLSFVEVEHERYKSGRVIQTSGATWSFSSKDIRPARAAVRQWRAALGQPAKGALRTRCLECGAETAGAAQVCARCGAPVAQQPRLADTVAQASPRLVFILLVVIFLVVWALMVAGVIPTSGDNSGF